MTAPVDHARRGCQPNLTPAQSYALRIMHAGGAGDGAQGQDRAVDAINED